MGKLSKSWESVSQTLSHVDRDHRPSEELDKRQTRHIVAPIPWYYPPSPRREIEAILPTPAIYLSWRVAMRTRRFLIYAVDINPLCRPGYRAITACTPPGRGAARNIDDHAQHCAQG